MMLVAGRLSGRVWQAKEEQIQNSDCGIDLHVCEDIKQPFNPQAFGDSKQQVKREVGYIFWLSHDTEIGAQS